MKAGTSRKAGSPRDAAKTLFRNAILDAAEGVFGDKGFHAARIQDIAAAAGVGVGTVYNHFAQKEDVLRALLDERTAEMVGVMDRRADDPAEFAEALEKRLARFLDYIDRHRSYFKLHLAFGLVSDTADASLKEIAGSSMKRIQMIKQRVHALMREGIEAGALDPAYDAENLAAFFGGTIRGVALGCITRNEPDMAARAAEVTHLFLHGAARPGKKGTR